MTIGNVGARSTSAYASLDAMAATNPMARVARVLLESKDRTEARADESYERAKVEVARHTDDEVKSLHSAATKTFYSALASGASLAAGAALSAYATANAPAGPGAAAAKKAVENARTGAQALTAGAPIAGKTIDAFAEHDRADAARARGDAAMARLDLDRADSEKRRAISGHDDVESAVRAANRQAHDAAMQGIGAIGK